MKVDYTPAELEIMKKHYPNTSGAEIMKLLPGRTKTSINKKAASMHLKKKPEFVKGYKGVKKAEADKVKYIKKRAKVKNARKEKAEKKKERTFKTRVVDPTAMKWVQVDYKTKLHVSKDKSDEEVISKFLDRQAKSNNAYKL